MTPLLRVKQALASYPDLKVILFDASTHTAQAAADTLGVAVGQIAKTLVFTTDDKVVLVVTCGDKKVHNKLLARVLGVRKVKFADTETVLHYTGFPPGGVSPIGLVQTLPIYLDRSLFQYNTVYAAAGTANSALPISPVRLQEITGGIVVDVCVDSQ